eukprot:2677114-Pleurochrysis_carterae.AAC.1
MRRPSPPPALPRTLSIGVEAESSADAARASCLKCASEPTATLRGVVSKCAAHEADCHRS